MPSVFRDLSKALDLSRSNVFFPLFVCLDEEEVADMSDGGKQRKIIRPDELILAVDALYGAIINGETANLALEALAHSMNSASCFFYPKIGAELLPHFPFSATIQPILEEFVRDGWHLQDLRAQRGWALAERGQHVLLEQDISTAQERQRLPYYQEFLRRHQMGWWAGVCFDANGRDWCLAIPRFDDQGAFSREDARVLSAIAPRLGPLLALAEKLGEARAAGAIDVLTRLQTPALIVDVFGRCLRVNEFAERLFDEDFYLSQRRPRARDADSNARMQTLLDRACAFHVGSVFADAPEPIVIRRSGSHPLVVEALPVRSSFADAFSSAAALVTITDIASHPAPPEKLLGTMFGLTPAEARFAATLASGAAINEAAETHHITRETARSRLKTVFAKTQTGRQAELIALLSRLARRAR